MDRHGRDKRSISFPGAQIVIDGHGRYILRKAIVLEFPSAQLDLHRIDEGGGS